MVRSDFAAPLCSQGLGRMQQQQLISLYQVCVLLWLQSKCSALAITWLADRFAQAKQAGDTGGDASAALRSTTLMSSPLMSAAASNLGAALAAVPFWRSACFARDQLGVWLPCHGVPTAHSLLLICLSAPCTLA
jgi:hypothetical protein